MTNCPNCNYLLVFLEHRRKYKCAKCGKLFSQKEIETKEFIQQNKKERTVSRKRWKKEANQNYQMRKMIPKIIEEIKNPKPRKNKEQYYEKKSRSSNREIKTMEKRVK